MGSNRLALGCGLGDESDSLYPGYLWVWSSATYTKAPIIMELGLPQSLEVPIHGLTNVPPHSLVVPPLPQRTLVVLHLRLQRKS